MTEDPTELSPNGTAPAFAGFGRAPRFGKFAVFALIVAAGFAPARALAAGTAGDDGAREGAAVEPVGRTFTVDARLGPAVLFKSRSHAMRHFVKPDLRLGARLAYAERWEFGVAVDGLLDASEHYRVLGLMGHARWAVVLLRSFSLGVSGALGAGYDADILHASLQAGGRVAPYYFVALDGRWQAGRWLLGVEAAYQNAAILQAGLLVGVQLQE